MHNIVVFVVNETLNCYMCPPTDGQTPAEANIECLALGMEITCAPNQNRCYSRVNIDSGAVEKGCAESDDCLGSTSCCPSSYCNADPQKSKTGQGSTCTSAGECIQGDSTMICDKEDPRDSRKVCLCTSDSYRRGATCKKKSYPEDLCTVSAHCYDVNSTCKHGRCRCAENMYANVTRCEDQRPLGDICSNAVECRGRNTDCIDSRCTCAFGYLVINGTDSCSDSTRLEIVNPVILAAVVSLGASVLMAR